MDRSCTFLKPAFKKALMASASLLLILVICYPVIKSKNTSSVNVYNAARPVVIIDAGHGGFDGGAVANDGTMEKDINLEIATALSEILLFSGYDVVMTRSTDTGTEDDSNQSISKRKVSDIKNRLNIINSYENSIFVSIHLNKFTSSSASGAQVFYSKNNKKSFELGNCIQSAVKSLLQNDNKRVIKQGTKNTYLLYHATKPAVIVECGFLSNKNDLALLKNQQYQKNMAYAVFCGINNYYLNGV